MARRSSRRPVGSRPPQRHRRRRERRQARRGFRFPVAHRRRPDVRVRRRRHLVRRHRHQRHVHHATKTRSRSNLRPTTGDDAYETTRARSLTVSMESIAPERRPPGSECDADASRLTYAWTNLTAPAPCLYTDVRSAVYDGYELEPRATRRSLTIPPFCLAASDAPHGFKLTASFGGEASSSATEILVTVRRTPLVAVLRGGAGPRKIQRGRRFPSTRPGRTTRTRQGTTRTRRRIPRRARDIDIDFCALVTETETPCPAAIDAALAEANALETSPSWTAIASGARFASATRTDSP